MHLEWNVEQARLYQLYATGLHGRDYPTGIAGIAACFRDLGSIQLDPLPIMGRNHDLVIQSRVAGVHSGETLDLIHQERLGFEYWDKAVCAITIESFPWFRALMNKGGSGCWDDQLGHAYPDAVRSVYEAVRAHGPVSSVELKNLGIAQGDGKNRGGWKTTKEANASLELLWNQGLISVSHRHNHRRYFDLTERVIPEDHLAGDPPTREEFLEYLLLRRVRTVGLLPARGGAEAWAMLRRDRAKGLPKRLLTDGRLTFTHVDGIGTTFYAPADAQEKLALAEKIALGCDARFLAPLDPLLWARSAAAKLWEFDYVWEVYKPAAKRRFGYYVLPILVGDRFVGRFDGRYHQEEKTLHVLTYLQEPGGLPLSHPAIHAGFQHFLVYLNGERIVLPTGEIWEREELE